MSWGIAVTRSLPRCGVVETLTISVDVRERRSGLPARPAELGLDVETVTLAVGDYAIGDRVIERKTITDLHRSLAHGLLWSQVGALRRDRRRAYLLVEGRDLDAGPLPVRAVRGALLKVVDNGVSLLRTTSPLDSAVWMDVLARQEGARRRGRPEARRLRQRRLVVSPVGVVASIPGIGLETATLLIATFGSIRAVAAASEDELQTVSGIGPEKAKALHLALAPEAVVDPDRPSVSPAQAGETLR